MKKLCIMLAIFIGCAENRKLDEQLPTIEISETKILTEGGGLVPITYRLGFKGNIINLTDEVFKSLIIIPITGQMLHFYLDAYLWKFSVKHNREVTLKHMYT